MCLPNIAGEGELFSLIWGNLRCSGPAGDGAISGSLKGLSFFARGDRR